MPPKKKIFKIGDDFATGPLLTSVNDLQQAGVSSEKVLRVDGASVVYANYTLLKHDFPQLQDNVLEEKYTAIKTLTGIAKQQALQQKINEWLLRNTAFISQSQAGQCVVNTTISIGDETVHAYRPPLYGRALVFSVEDNEQGLSLTGSTETAAYENRLLDVKGIGVAPHVKPLNEIHCTGLIPVGEVLYELLIQELFQRIFRHSKTAFQTLPVYAIIDLGFNEACDGVSTDSAGLMVRRAHRRPKNSGGLYPYNSTGQRVQLEIELLLRKYGITSTDKGTTIKVWKENGQFHIKYGRKLVNYLNESQKAEIEKVSHYEEHMGELSFDGINIQHTREIDLNPSQATLVDFQAYRIIEKFENPILSLVCDKLMLWGGSVWPHYKSFVQPDSNLQIPLELVGKTVQTLGYEIGLGDAYAKMNSLCFGLATDFRNQKITSEILKQKLQFYLDTLIRHWIT